MVSGKTGHFVAQCPAPHRLQLTLKSKVSAKSHATETAQPVAKSDDTTAEHHRIESRAPKRTRFGDTVAHNKEQKERGS